LYSGFSSKGIYFSIENMLWWYWNGAVSVPIQSIAITNGSELSLPDQKISKGDFDRENLEHELE
jgi:hypothetical protein